MSKPNLEDDFGAKNSKIEEFDNLSFDYASKFIHGYMKTFGSLLKKYLNEDNTEKIVELYRNTVEMYSKIEKKVPENLKSQMLGEASYYEGIGDRIASGLVLSKCRQSLLVRPLNLFS